MLSNMDILYLSFKRTLPSLLLNFFGNFYQYSTFATLISLSSHTITGSSVSKLKITFTKNISRFIGRTIPILGWIILAANIVHIFYKSQSIDNQIVNNSDMLLESL